jgi:hypothetical protein
LDKVFSHLSAKLYYKRGDFDINQPSRAVEAEGIKAVRRVEAASSERERAVSVGAENTD